MASSLRIIFCRLLRCSTVVMVAILFLPMANSVPGQTDCLVPDEAQLLSLLIESGGTVLIPPGDRGEGPEPVLPNPSGISTVPDSDDPTGHSGVTPVHRHCPVGERPTRDAPINEAASCPWRFVANRDPARYPQTVLHAVRRCGSCLGPDGAVLAGTRCEPVTYPTKVLRQRGCEQPGGTMQYGVEDMEQTVAFQCIIPVA